MDDSFQILSPREEVQYMRRVLGLDNSAQLLDRVIGNFNVLQARSAMLLSLVTLCLTISGFSGHRIASAGRMPAIFLSVGLTLAVFSAIMILSGPLKLRWATRYVCGDDPEETLVALVALRNLRTRRYHLAACILVLGLTSYVLAVVLSVLPGGGA
ncbi:MAG: hypothetical protein JJU29_05825 [Verrucomicrobia bacterium]|nr:hypothetical protein [Verrucomicrobiota bacterium]MCH8510685.1 hypothetical protein [Kiritimatiellia bacterium]